MSVIAELRCRCGSVEGRVASAAAKTVNRVVCYCDDCQAFAHALGRADLLDAQGGSDIVQVAPAALSFTRGREHIVGLRLTEKGLYRWYTECCKTPIGNTLGTSIPFVGILAQSFRGVDGGSANDYFGPPIGRIFGKFAVGEPPAGSTKPDWRLMARTIRMVLGWKLSGRTWPHPFYERGQREPMYPVKVLSGGEREALRPLCGPQRGAAAAARIG
jgi:hypothetical protein